MAPQLAWRLRPPRSRRPHRARERSKEPTNLLAYVFWHGLAEGADAAEHERFLAAYHRELAAHRPPGFIESAAFRIPDVPWLPRGGYEDWYLVDGSKDLDPLNEAAVSGELSGPHAVVARDAGVMAAGLYRMRAGEVGVDAATATWFSKPTGTSYEALYAVTDDLVRRPATSLWRRQMVLGPTPEFCLLSPAALTLDPATRAIVIDRLLLTP